MKKSLVVVSLTAALAAALSASGSGAAASKCKLLVPGKSLGCVSLGMTQAQVRSVAGAPLEATQTTGCCGKILTFAYRGFDVSFLGPGSTFRHVSWVESTSRTYRTAKGVGVGSTKAQLLAGVKGLRCGAFHLAKTFCILGKSADDPKQTLFMLRNGKVALERLGFQPE